MVRTLTAAETRYGQHPVLLTPEAISDVPRIPELPASILRWEPGGTALHVELMVRRHEQIKVALSREVQHRARVGLPYNTGGRLPLEYLTVGVDGG